MRWPHSGIYSKELQKNHDTTGAENRISNAALAHHNITDDEVQFYVTGIDNLIEASHSSSKILHSDKDIKDALIELVIFTNGHTVWIDGIEYDQKPILKLISEMYFSEGTLYKRWNELWQNLNQDTIDDYFDL